MTRQKHIKKEEISEYDFSYILSKSPGYIYWKNTNSCYMGCNERLAKFSGLKSPDDIVGKTDYDFEWGSEQATQFVQDDKYVMETQETLITEYELAQERDDGQKLFVRTEKMPLYNANNEVVGILAIAYDITEVKALQRKLIEEKNKAEQANQAKTEFIRNMEHDIRTPFTGILGLAEYLHSQEIDTYKKEHLLDIKLCAQELLNYCNSILDFSKVESELLPVLNQKFNFRELFDSILKIERPAALSKGLALEYSYDKNIPNVLLGDKYRIKSILINLVSNAIKFTDTGYVKLSVSTISQVDKTVLIRMNVSDTGTGIPPEKKVFIFEKFARLTDANKGRYRGIGLGLRIVKQFMQELEGEIDIISDPNGTQFICTIPFKLPLTTDYVET